MSMSTTWEDHELRVLQAVVFKPQLPPSLKDSPRGVACPSEKTKGDGVNAGIIAALVLAVGGFVASAAASFISARTERWVANYEARRPAYTHFLDLAAHTFILYGDALDALRGRWNPADLPELWRIRREGRAVANEMREAFFSVQLIAAPKVFEAADELLNIVAAGSHLLKQLDSRGKSKGLLRRKLAHLGGELLAARDAFVSEARDELGLKHLPERRVGEKVVQDILDRVS